MGEFQTEGGGVHPGKPIIWPTGKASSAPISGAQQAQTAGGVKSLPGQTAPVKPGEIAPPPEIASSPGAAAAPRIAPIITRPLTIEDLRSHLLSLQIEPDDFNTKLASLMLRNGVEISRANFVKILSMLQGTNKSQPMQEAALLLLMKGIDSPEAVKVLGQYFTENPSLAANVLALQEGLRSLTSALGLGKGLLDANLISQLTALLSQFDSELRNANGKFSSKSLTGKGNTIGDVRALKALLEGLKGKTLASNTPQAQALSSSLMAFQGKLDSVMQNLIAQGVLSQSGRSEVNYHYQQIPNTMTTPPKDFEIVVRRDGEGKKAVIDPRNTQIVISMDTGNMGKMVISMIVKDNKVYVIFVFNEKDYGDKGRSMIAKEFGDFQQKLADKNFMITGYQVKVDPAMCGIRPYLIPMLPRLDDLLRRIDIEA